MLDSLVKKFFRAIVYPATLATAFLSPSFAQEMPTPLPRRFNPNIVGRLFVQHDDLFSDQVVEGLKTKIEYGTSVNYNTFLRPHDLTLGESFDGKEGTLKSNHTNVSMGTSYGFLFSNVPIELGLQIRMHTDHSFDTLSYKFVQRFHKAIGNSTPPKDLPYNGNLGKENLLAKDGRIKIGYVLPSIKIQLFDKEKDFGNLAVSLYTRLPFSAFSKSGPAYDTVGIGCAVTGSKDIVSETLDIVISFALNYQDLDSSDFNDPNLSVSKFHYTAFTGVRLEEEIDDEFDFFLTTGINISSQLVEYKDNQDSARDTLALEAAFGFKTGKMVILFGASEDLAGFGVAGQSNRDDINFYFQFSYMLGSD